MDLDSGGERSGNFSAAGSNTAPPFETQESILNEMAEFVEIFVIFPQMLSVLFCLYHSPDLPENIPPGIP